MAVSPSHSQITSGSQQATHAGVVGCGSAWLKTIVETTFRNKTNRMLLSHSCGLYIKASLQAPTLPIFPPLFLSPPPPYAVLVTDQHETPSASIAVRCHSVTPSRNNSSLLNKYQRFSIRRLQLSLTLPVQSLSNACSVCAAHTQHLASITLASNNNAVPAAAPRKVVANYKRTVAPCNNSSNKHCSHFAAAIGLNRQGTPPCNLSHPAHRFPLT